MSLCRFECIFFKRHSTWLPTVITWEHCVILRQQCMLLFRAAESSRLFKERIYMLAATEQYKCLLNVPLWQMHLGPFSCRMLPSMEGAGLNSHPSRRPLEGLLWLNWGTQTLLTFQLVDCCGALKGCHPVPVKRPLETRLAQSSERRHWRRLTVTVTGKHAQRSVLDFLPRSKQENLLFCAARCCFCLNVRQLLSHPSRQIATTELLQWEVKSEKHQLWNFKTILILIAENTLPQTLYCHKSCSLVSNVVFRQEVVQMVKDCKAAVTPISVLVAVPWGDGAGGLIWYSEQLLSEHTVSIYVTGICIGSLTIQSASSPETQTIVPHGPGRIMTFRC